MLACWLYSRVPTPTPNTTMIASQRSNGSRTISFRPSSTLPPIGCSPDTSCCSCSRSTAQCRSRLMLNRQMARNPAEPSIRLAMPTRCPSAPVMIGPRKAPMVPAAPM
ncbi:hypothetical protein G6F24_016663 [Rhizopus arrhizus]|nr:hypothetical protein G6F24_016663 [Rhizopus arrhizus]